MRIQSTLDFATALGGDLITDLERLATLGSRILLFFGLLRHASIPFRSSGDDTRADYPSLKEPCKGLRRSQFSQSTLKGGRFPAD